MRVLVTGGTGFIASHLSETLVRQGHDVTILDDFSSGLMDNIQKILSSSTQVNLVTGDCKNLKDVQQAMHGIDIVFRFSTPRRESRSPLRRC